MLNIVVVQENLESKEDTKTLFPNICKAIKEISVSDDVFIHTLADQSLSPRLVEWCVEENIAIKVYPFRARFSITSRSCEYSWWGRKSYVLPMNKIKGELNNLGLAVSADFMVSRDLSLKDIFGPSAPPLDTTKQVIPTTEHLRTIATHIDSCVSRSNYFTSLMPKGYIILEASLGGKNFIIHKGHKPSSWTVSDKKIHSCPLPKNKTYTHLDINHDNILTTIMSFEETTQASDIFPYEINKFRCLIASVVRHIGFISGSVSDIMKSKDEAVNQSTIANSEARHKLLKPLFTGEDIISLDTEQFDMTIRNKLIHDIYWILDDAYGKEAKGIIKLIASDKDAYEAWRPELGRFAFRAGNDTAIAKIHKVAKLSKYYSLASRPNKTIPLPDELLPKIKLHSK